MHSKDATYFLIVANKNDRDGHMSVSVCFFHCSRLLTWRCVWRCATPAVPTIPVHLTPPHHPHQPFDQPLAIRVTAQGHIRHPVKLVGSKNKTVYRLLR